MIDQLLDQYIELRDLRARLGEQIKDIFVKQKEIERKLRAHAEATGATKFGSDRATCSVTEDIRIKYDPEQWQAVVAWAVESGNIHVIQRRLTDAKILELMDQGVQLPDGLTPDPYTKVRVTRTRN